jgi:hypothetical protein
LRFPAPGERTSGPVFERVDRMRAAGELRNLRGLLYFTDGYGTFPLRKPEYQTAFIFVREGFEIPKVPSWAMRLVLDAGSRAACRIRPSKTQTGTPYATQCAAYTVCGYCTAVC